MKQKSRFEKGGFILEGINLALCENPIPPIEEAIEAAQAETCLSNHYTEPYSWKLKEKISNYINVPTENIHINAGSELILRQLFLLCGKKVHLISPTYYLFEEIAEHKTYTFLDERTDFLFDMRELDIPGDTTLAVIINPNNPTGTLFDIKENIEIIEKHPETMFLIDEAFIEFGKTSAADLTLKYGNVVVTRTFSKAFSLAGCRVGYAIANTVLTDRLNSDNDAYPLARTAEAAAMASLDHIGKITDRVKLLKKQSNNFAESLQHLGIKTYPTETYFFLGKVSHMSADAFSEALGKKGIYIRPLHQEGLENRFVRFATSNPDNDRIVIDAIKEILKGYQNVKPHE
jgi:histidinol-phosphate aminotransferase